MLHTVELPAGVTHLNTSLANMNGNDFSHFYKNKDELTLCEGRKISNEEKELGATTLKHGRASSHPVSSPTHESPYYQSRRTFTVVTVKPLRKSDYFSYGA